MESSPDQVANKPAQPHSLTCCTWCSNVLNFALGECDNLLFLWCPCDQAWTKEECHTRCALSFIKISCMAAWSVTITDRFKFLWFFFEIHATDSSQWCTECLHEPASLSNTNCNVRSSIQLVLQTSKFQQCFCISLHQPLDQSCSYWHEIDFSLVYQ